MTNPQDDFLLGGGSKSAFGKNDPVGTTVTGVITSTEVRQQTDMETSKPLFWDDGSPREQLVVHLKTTLRDPSDPEDDGSRALYVKGSKAPGSQSLHDAVRSAVVAAKAPGLQVGGTLGVRFIGTEPPKTKGFNDRKLWAAQYKAPDNAGGFLGTTPPAAAPPSPVQNPATGQWELPPVTAAPPAAPPVAATPPAPPQPVLVNGQWVLPPATPSTPPPAPTPPPAAPAGPPQPVFVNGQWVLPPAAAPTAADPWTISPTTDAPPF